MIKEHRVFNPCIFRSPWARPIWTDTTGVDVATSIKNHPEEFLKAIAGEGFNGIWLNAIFRTLVPSSLYPEIKPGKMDILQRLVDRTSKFGIKVYLLLHEPRAPSVDDPFWKTHAHLKGQPFNFRGVSSPLDDIYPALCSSTPDVKLFLEESAWRLFKGVPGLGGVLLITASECQTHCYSHFSIPQKKFSEPDMEAWSKAEFVCPRCKPRRAIDVVAEIIGLINRGARQASRDALVIAHTWSWYLYEPDSQSALIRRLPRDVALFSDWERGGRKMILGKQYPVDEYSYAYCGPSPRFRRQCVLVKRRGMRMLAKISINGTHEMRAIPYLPVPGMLAQKMKRMRRIGVDGYEGCMPFGGEITPMAKLAGLLSRAPRLSAGQAVRVIAEQEYGKTNAPYVCRAWRCFSKAWTLYPFAIPLLYYGPINYAAAYPFRLPVQPAGRIAGWLPLPRDKRGHLKVGDNLETWLHDFSPAMVIRSFQHLARAWRKGLVILEQQLNDLSGSGDQSLKKEYWLARHIYLSVQSTINIVRFYSINRKLEQDCPANAVPRLRLELKQILEEELATAQEDRTLITADNRLGYHPEAHLNMFDVKDLEYKARLCRSLIRKLGRPAAICVNQRQQRNRG